MLVMRPFLAAALLVAAASPLAAQGRGMPDSLVNTKVFPHDTPVREVVSAMRGFTAALGVRCDYCHEERQAAAQAGGPGGPGELDFPSDAKRTKRTARLMMLMVRQVNDSVLSRIPERPAPNVAVACMTCHRGVARPKPLADIVTEAVAAGGLDSATRAYRALRQQYYGRAAYDFGEGTLIAAAQGLLQARRADDALGLLTLDAEFFPSSGAVVGQMGEAYLAKGDTAAAIARYRQALQLDPNDRFARMRLRALGVTN
jgi:tetratricopeptide (TPR) repeat protein